MKKIITFIPALFLVFEITVFAFTLEKHQDDKSVSRYFVLENGIKVLLVSDPEFNISSAALEVQAGSLMDPEDRQGLAHFTEHMLFLGTEKYPDVKEYPRYLDSHGGYANAYTAESLTNYHFEVQHDGFEGALDRFSQFFISPLFSPEYIERELKAVHSEHQKNLEQDSWRQMQLFRTFYEKDHPSNHFSTGNMETLKGVTREEFVRFYNKYYSANRMSLVLLSNNSLDDMESLARKYFLPVKNNHRNRTSFDPDYLSKVTGLRLIKRVPVKDLRSLTLTFAIPSYIDNYDVKPSRLIAFCIGHEGKGSLLSFLKDQGLATGLSAGAGYPTLDYGRFVIDIQLTPKGLECYHDVIKYCFSYIRLLREQGIPDHSFSEIQRMAELDFTYENKGEGAKRASELASNMNRYPPEVALTVDYLYKELDQKLVHSVLNRLHPDNMLCMLTAKGMEADSIETYYNTRYSYDIKKGDSYNSLLDPPAVNTLSLPVPNPFVPDKVGLLAERPVNLIYEPGLELWYAQDVTFKRPRVSLSFRLKNPEELVNPAYMTRLNFYTACVNEKLNEMAYSAHEAGLDYNFSADLEGVDIIISGYEDSVRMLLKEICKGLKFIDISEQKFGDIRDRMLRQWNNFKMSQAWEIARYISRRIRKETYFSYESFVKEGEKLALSDIRQFSDNLYEKTLIESLVHGNITAREAKSLARLLQACLSSEPLEKDHAFEQGILVEKENEHLTYVEKLQTNNSCFWRTVHMGDDSPELRMASRVIEKFISQPFYTEMRTKQQLGYIVWSVAPEDHGQHYLFFIVQSESHPADEIRERANLFINGLPSRFEQISDTEFDRFKAAVRTELFEKPKSINEKRVIFDRRIFEYSKDFNRLHENLDALESLTRAKVSEILSDSLDPGSREMVDILLFAKQHDMRDNTSPSIESIDSFKEGREFMPGP